MRAGAVLAICLAASIAHADPRGDIAKQVTAAMANYDLMDYDAAKKALAQAIVAGSAAKLDNDPVMARAYLDLGVVLFAAGDEAGAKKSFALALKIDPKIQIEPGYRSKENAKLLDDTRGGGASTAECAPGLQHVVIDNAKAGAALPIEATVGAGVAAKRVSVLYRAEGATDFTEVQLASKDNCKYTGSIPATALRGSLVHYYVAAYGDGPKPLAQVGSSSAPNIIELTGGGGGGGDKENPLPTDQPTNEVDKGVEVTPGQHTLSIGLGIGGGFGIIRGADTTENMNPIDSAGFGHSVMIAPEVSYQMSPQLAIGAVARLALPYDANIAGHSSIGPAGLVRVRYTPDNPPLDGLHYIGELGAGITRSTLEISGAMPSQGNIDVVATGPLLLGGGVSYTRPLSSSFTFVADASLLLGIAVVDKIGLAAMNTGATLDLSLGVAFGL